MRDTHKKIPKKNSEKNFPIVGIGASAGGLDAFKRLVGGIAEDSGAAYILVQHLDPTHESALPEILQKSASIPVWAVEDNMAVEPDHIYIIPSNKLLIAIDGILKLSPRPGKEEKNRPIDLFFSSLAEVHQGDAIGVVLSGTGTDGTAGLKAIKEHGGMTFAQEPTSAAYDGMPQSAIDGEAVDFVLPPEEIPGRLMELKTSYGFFSSTIITAAEEEPPDQENFKKILTMLRIRKGVDFSLYKQTTIRRRIIRRMALVKKETIADYARWLKKDLHEQDALFQDLLIPVTSFFRDPEIFYSLSNTIFPALIKNKSAYDPLRIWVVGCSTGQEAYSLAISLLEYIGDEISTLNVKIFASDISEISIAKARTGLYLEKEVEGIDENQLSRFFNKRDGQYQIKNTVRDLCVFAIHNFLKDPPFAKMDLISCRNVLIYLEPFLQTKALTAFHYALKDKGMLWLGKSETTGDALELFTPYDKQDKFYTRKPIQSRFANLASEHKAITIKDNNQTLKNTERKKDDIQKSAEEILLAKYTPAGVIVNEHFDIVQIRGSTGDYLEPSPGKASLSVLKMARDGLSFEIRSALQRSKATGEPFIKEAIPINKGKKLVTIEVIPLPDTMELHFLILFKESRKPLEYNDASAATNISPEKAAESPEHSRIRQLEQELAQTRENMRNITEDQEAINAQLQSVNEELLSSGEELQSLNEELETSKEELQSTNEELQSLNGELNKRNEELNQSRQFSETIIASLYEPILVLEENFRIKKANKAFYHLFQLSDEETLGKILFELHNKDWDIPALHHRLLKIKEGKEKSVEIEVLHRFSALGERTIRFNIQCINEEPANPLFLLTLNDITVRKHEQVLKTEIKAASSARQILHRFFMQTPAMMSILTGPEHTFEFANDPYRQLIGDLNPVGKTVKELLPGKQGQQLNEILDKVYQTGESFIAKGMPGDIWGGRENSAMFIDIVFQVYKNDHGKTEGILVFCYDVTKQIIARDKIKESEIRYRDLIYGLPVAVYSCDEKGYINFTSVAL